MPNQEPIKKWILALRSGEFNQTHGRLRNGTTNEFCCLGVGCEIFRRETGVGEWNEEGHFIIHDKKEVKIGTLPPTVQEWLGILALDPFVKDEYSLSSLNDVKNLSFLEISNEIEKEWVENDVTVTG